MINRENIDDDVWKMENDVTTVKNDVWKNQNSLFNPGVAWTIDDHQINYFIVS